MIDFYVKRGDTSPALQVQLVDIDDQLIEISGSSVYFNYRLRNNITSGSPVSKQSTIYSAESGLVEHYWESGVTDTAGLYNGEFVVCFEDGSQSTFPPGGPFVFEIVEDVT